MTRLPSFGRKVRGRVTGFFDRTSMSCRKTGRIHAATLRAFLHPPAAVIRGPRRAKSQEPRAKSQEQRAKSKEQRAKREVGMLSRAPAPSPQPSPARGEGEVRCIADQLKKRSQSKGRCEARLRLKSSAIRARCAVLRSARCGASHGCPATTILKRSGLSQHDAASLCSEGHFLWVTFLLGQQKKSDSSGGSRSKRPPRRRPDRGSAA
ncbi:hypothetical protein ABIC75_001442 [Dyella japonica]|uniref:Uncharacterized protein n=1 Tax=Dyella japonica TaxID=231455 RepID=A0ABV2JSA6_9GAMM